MSAKHSSDHRDERARLQETLHDRRERSEWLIARHRKDAPVRTSAGICPSCERPIDAATAECGCSS